MRNRHEIVLSIIAALFLLSPQGLLQAQGDDAGFLDGGSAAHTPSDPLQVSDGSGLLPGEPTVEDEDTDDVATEADKGAKLKQVRAKAEQIFKVQLALMKPGLSAERRAELRKKLVQLNQDYDKLRLGWISEQKKSVAAQLQDPELGDQRRATLEKQAEALALHEKTIKAREPVLETRLKLEDPSLSKAQRKALGEQLAEQRSAFLGERGKSLKAQEEFLRSRSQDPGLGGQQKADLEQRLKLNKLQQAHNDSWSKLLELRAKLRDPDLTASQKAALQKEAAAQRKEVIQDRIKSLQQELKLKSTSETRKEVIKARLKKLRSEQGAQEKGKAGGITPMPRVPDVGGGGPARR